MSLTIGIIIGILIGFLVTGRGCALLVMGTLVVKTSDEDGPYLFLELSKGVNTIASKKYIILEVNTKHLFPHK